MSERDTADQRRSQDATPGRTMIAMSDFLRSAPPERRGAEGPVVSFDRTELREIFGVYGRRVAEGEWRDYAIDFTSAKAVFSIYRRTSEVPLFRVEKDPSLARRQGAYSVIAASGLVLKRGSELRQVLKVLEPKPKLVIV